MKWLAVGGSALLVAMLTVPLAMLVLAGGSAATPCGPAVLTADGSPTILGTASLTAQQITTWWTGAYGATTSLGVPVSTMVGWYLDHGTVEGVRGDYALAQAFVETMSNGQPFNSGHAIQQNDFAGIGVSSDSAPGYNWPTPEIGVIAQLQLLKKVVDGNSAPLSEPNVSPTWGGRAGITTWAGLAGNWATNPQYWVSPTSTDTISGWYAKMAGTPASTPATLVDASASTTTTTGPGGTATPGGCPTGGAGPDCVTSQGATTTTTTTTATSPGAVAADPLAPMWAFLCAQLGKPYAWGGSGPDSWDCSGLTQAAYATVGVTLPRTSETQYGAVHATMVPLDQLQPGDLVFFEGVPPGHVGIVVQAAAPGQLPKMEDAPHTGAFVEIVDVWAAAYVGAGVPTVPAPVHP